MTERNSFQNPPPQFLLLDTVELVFRDQYMGRSEMWRLKSKLVKCGCVHLNKKIELCGGSLRCHINEMWSKDAEVLRD